MTLALATATPSVFSVPHITLTAAITAVLAGAAALWRIPRDRPGAWIDIAAVAVLSFASVLLWRWSANMPQLNDDGLHGFSANDWAAPTLTYIFLSLYADIRRPTDPPRYNQTRAMAFLVSLAVNVITI